MYRRLFFFYWTPFEPRRDEGHVRNWIPHDDGDGLSDLGRAPHGGLSTALENVRHSQHRGGIGIESASASASATSPRLQQIESASASIAATVAKATEAELCPTCVQALGPMDEVVEYRCRHHFHTHCHSQLVQTGRMQCPVWGDIVVLEAQQSAAAADEALCLEFSQGAHGTAEVWQRFQLHSRLPRSAVFKRPSLELIAESWVRSFLSRRS